MRVQPRQELLALWQAAVAYTCPRTDTVDIDSRWRWGGVSGRNAVSDAEQLLTFLYPGSVLESLRFDRPDQTTPDVLEALRGMGDERDVPRMLVRALGEYFRTYELSDGTPSYAGGSYFRTPDPGREPTPEQLELDVIDGFSLSISLSLAALSFIRTLRTSVRRRPMREQLTEVERAASHRLTGAMLGLLRSFVVQAFPSDSAPGRTLQRTVNQAGMPRTMFEEQMRTHLREVRASLIGLPGVAPPEMAENENLLFECGWSWGVVRDAPKVSSESGIHQRDGVAAPRPFLYCTAIALAGIEDVISRRTQINGLLNTEQQALARDLQVRWELTQQYWATIASFGSGRWPLEDIPWRTTDQKESDYYSLLVSSIVVGDLVRRRADDADLAKVGAVLRELGGRARVTRRPLEDDPALKLHVPGVELRLYGAEALGPELVWPVADFSTALFKRTVLIAAVARGTELRNDLLSLADEVWEHLSKRRIDEGSSLGLWDEPSGAFEGLPGRNELVSWSLTERIGECLVAAAGVVNISPLRSGVLIALAEDLINEADHLYNRELLKGSFSEGHQMRTVLQTIGDRLQRAQEVRAQQPGTAMAIALDVLREVDHLAMARSRSTWTG